MLLPNFLYRITDKIVKLWEKLNLFAVRDICRRIAEAEGHMTATAEWQIYKLEQAGLSRDAIKKEIQRLLKLSEQQVKELFEEAIVESHNNDADIFREAGVESEPFGTSASSKQLQVLYEQTNNELENFTRTTALSSQRAYIEACDEAFMKVKSGLMSPQEAIREAIEKAAAGGLYVEYPSGHRDTVEVAVRRAVLTGINRASLQLTIDECERKGTNFVIVSSHLGARVSKDNAIANHYGWQGGIYRIWPDKPDFWGKLERFSKIVGKQNYPLLEEATGYPSDPLGLGGYNCRHSMYPYMPGITESHMKQFDPEENRKAYELSQEQRRQEREIRKTKRKLEGAREAYKAADDQELKKGLEEDIRRQGDQLKLQERKYSEFCEKNELREDGERTYNVKKSFVGNDEDMTVQKLENIDKDIYQCITPEMLTEETIITQEQIDHIAEHHPDAYEDVMQQINEVLRSPDYILRDKLVNTGLVIKRIENEEEHLLLVLRIKVQEDPEEYMNSIISGWKISDRRLKNYLRKKVILYKSID